MVNGVGFVISEDLTSGSGTRLDRSTAFVSQSFIEVKNGQRKLLTQTSEGGRRVPLSLVLARELYTSLVITVNQKKSQSCKDLTRPTPIIDILR